MDSIYDNIRQNKMTPPRGKTEVLQRRKLYYQLDVCKNKNIHSRSVLNRISQTFWTYPVLHDMGSRQISDKPMQGGNGDIY